MHLFFHMYDRCFLCHQSGKKKIKREPKFRFLARQEQRIQPHPHTKSNGKTKTLYMAPVIHPNPSGLDRHLQLATLLSLSWIYARV
jgi:hypothetical protein